MAIFFRPRALVAHYTCLTSLADDRRDKRAGNSLLTAAFRLNKVGAVAMPKSSAERYRRLARDVRIESTTVSDGKTKLILDEIAARYRALAAIEEGRDSKEDGDVTIIYADVDYFNLGPSFRVVELIDQEGVNLGRFVDIAKVYESTTELRVDLESKLKTHRIKMVITTD